MRTHVNTMTSINHAGELNTANETLGAELTMEALAQINGGGFWSRLSESVGRLAEGVGVVTGSPLLIGLGGLMY